MRRAWRDRRGSVLILVLVLIPILALGAYAFNHAMRAESAGSNAAVLQAQARWLAEAGLESACSLMTNKTIFTQSGGVDFHNNPGQFGAQHVADAVGGMPAGMFSIVAADELTEGSIRYGFVSECAKIPLGGKLALRKEALMLLPNMTDDIADSIIDYCDADDDPQPNGAESNYYASLSPPRQARNGAPLCIDELLLVKGITPALLYGNDSNLDGLSQKSETDLTGLADSSSSATATNTSTGILDRGWYHYFTIHSVADNTKSDGTNKTNLNGDQTAAVTALKNDFGTNVAAFYVAYRTKQSTLTSIADLIESEVDVESQQLQQAWQAAGLDPNEAASALGITLPPPNQNQGGQGGGSASGGSASGGGSGGARSGGATTQTVTTSSSGDKVVSSTTSQGGGGGPQPPIHVTSPWKSGDAGNFYDKALTTYAIDDQKTAQGVIDVQYAPTPVLMCLPEMTQDVADKISSSAAGKTGVLTSPAWLLTESLVPLDLMKKIESKVTVAPRTFRMESVGFFERNGPVARIEAIIDASGTTPQILQRRDLTPVGNGYPQEMLRSSGVTP